MSAILETIRSLNIPNSAVWVAEAEFGLRYIREYMQELPVSSSILEVGCGSGILLSMLAEEFPSHNFQGIEPFGDGFGSLRELNSLVKESGVQIANTGYENFSNTEKFDCIYCVNVFEHVKNWRHFLDWISASLAEGGVFVVLCPNYSFPYESHFRIPIIFNKKLTKSLFSKYLREFEIEHDFDGLWNSLNFVTKKDVKKYIDLQKSLGLTLTDDVAIIDDMVNRLAFDTEFQKRQSVIGAVALFMKRIGIFNLVKLFPNYLPYMKLSFSKCSNIS